MTELHITHSAIIATAIFNTDFNGGKSRYAHYDMERHGKKKPPLKKKKKIQSTHTFKVVTSALLHKPLYNKLTW